MKRKKRNRMLLAGLLLCLAGCGKAQAAVEAQAPVLPVQKAAEIATIEEPEPVDVPPALCVRGTQLVDSEGNPVQLRGISTHGLAWFPEYVNEACFRQLKEEWGINVIRLAMYTAESGGYCTDGDQDRLKELVRKGVDCAERCGLYVILDWHILSDGNPNTHLWEAEAFFDEMSKAYEGRTNVLYEICNEPNGGVSWAEIKAYAERVCSVIRRNDPDGVILIGTPNWCQLVEQAADDPIEGIDNIMYTLHFYAATHKQELRDSMVAALEKGLPLFVSEFGICDASGNGAIDPVQADKWLRLLEERNISYVAWNLSNKAETSALLQSGCGKTSGFSESDISASGKWLRQALTGTPAAFLPAEEKQESVGKTTAGDGFSVEVTVVNRWEENGKAYAQYECRLTNPTAQAKDGWNVELCFDGMATLVNSWNGTFQMEGDRLSISPLEYNSRIEGGSGVAGIGFILCSDGQRNLL